MLTPEKGYKIKSATYCGESLTIVDSYFAIFSVTVSGDKVFAVEFEKEPFNITVINDADKGSVSVSSGSYASGTELTINVSALDGYLISSVSYGDDSPISVHAKSYSLNVTVSSDVTFTVNYEVQKVSFIISNNDIKGTIAGVTGGDHNYGESFNVTVTAKDGYEIAGISFKDNAIAITDKKQVVFSITFKLRLNPFGNLFGGRKSDHRTMRADSR